MMIRDKLLSIFLETDEYVSGEWLSEQLHCSRTAVWKQIQNLKSQGYIFEATPRLGYKLVGKPEKLDLVRLQNLLKTRTFGRKLKYFDSVTSTQQVAHEWFRDGGREGDIVVAEEQTEGRGRRGKNWHSPKGKGLWFSLILQPRLNFPKVPQLTLMTVVALCRCLRKTTAVDVGIKWPNDLLCKGKKLAGILIESVGEDERLLYVVAGVGISVNLTKADYPETVQKVATSLEIETEELQDREQLLASFLLEWEQIYSLYLLQGFSAIRSIWESYSVTLHEKVTIHTTGGVVQGVAIGLNENGALIIRQEDKNEIAVYAGDIDNTLSS